MREHSLLLRDILEAAESIHDFTQGMSCEAFVDDDRTLISGAVQICRDGGSNKIFTGTDPFAVPGYSLAEYCGPAGQSNPRVYRCGL